MYLVQGLMNQSGAASVIVMFLYIYESYLRGRTDSIRDVVGYTMGHRCPEDLIIKDTGGATPNFKRVGKRDDDRRGGTRGE